MECSLDCGIGDQFLGFLQSDKCAMDQQRASQVLPEDHAARGQNTEAGLFR